MDSSVTGDDGRGRVEGGARVLCVFKGRRNAAAYIKHITVLVLSDYIHYFGLSNEIIIGNI